MIEEAAAATRAILPVERAAEPPPALRYQVKLLVDVGDVSSFLARWHHITATVGDRARTHRAEHGVTAPPPIGLISDGWMLSTTERAVWVPEQTHLQELIAWSARVRSERNG